MFYVISCAGFHSALLWCMVWYGDSNENLRYLFTDEKLFSMDRYFYIMYGDGL